MLDCSPMIKREVLRTLLNLAEFRTTDTHLHEAAHKGDIESLKHSLRNEELLKCIDNRNLLGCTALRLAASGGHTSCLRELLHFNASVDISDVKAQTPLHAAVKAKSHGCVEALLQAGANPDGDWQNNSTPIYYAAMDGSHAIVRDLIEYGADIDNAFQLIGGNWSSTPLYVTVVYKKWKSFCILLLLGADPNLHCKHNKDDRGKIKSSESLYHGVVSHDCDSKYAELLYKCGAKLSYRNLKGKLAWELDGDNDIKSYLVTISVNPMKLKDICRISIRQSLGRFRLKSIDDLSIPQALIEFVKFQNENFLE